jgi:hypothetical protein
MAEWLALVQWAQKHGLAHLDTDVDVLKAVVEGVLNRQPQSTGLADRLLLACFINKSDQISFPQLVPSIVKVCFYRSKFSIN